MSKHQVLQSLTYNKKGKLFFVVKIIFLFSFVVGLGIYIGNLLFGKNSLEVLLNLQEKKNMLQTQIKRYKHENANLQKEYFELLQLEPDIN